MHYWVKFHLFLFYIVKQEANAKNHKVSRVVFLGNMKRLLTTGVSRWNTRQIALWDQVRRTCVWSGFDLIKYPHKGG